MDIASIGISLDTSDLKAGIQTLGDVGKAADAAADSATRVGQSTGKMATDYVKGVNDITTASNVATTQKSRYIQALEIEANTLGKMRQEASTYTAMVKALSDAEQRMAAQLGASIDAYNRAETAARDMAKSQDLSGKALLEYKAAQMGLTASAAPLIAGLKDSGHAMDGFSLSSSIAKRELLVMSREAASGNFTRLASSFSIFAQSSGLMGVVMSATGAAIIGAVAAVGALAVAYAQGSKEAGAFNKALILTGNYAGETTSQMADMAAAMATGNISQHEAAAVLAETAGSGKIAGDALAMVAKAAIEMEQTTGEKISKTIEQFVKLADEPTKASVKLNETLHYLTASVYDQIAALEKAGDKDAAAALAQKAYAQAVDDRANQIKGSLGTLQTAWNFVGEAAKKAWNSMLNVGRPDTITQQIANVDKQLAEAQSNKAGGLHLVDTSAQVAALQALRAQLAKTNFTLSEHAAAQGIAEQATQKGIAASQAQSKMVEQLATKEQKADAERLIAKQNAAGVILKINNNMALSDAQRADQIAKENAIESGLIDNITAKYATKSKAVAGMAATERDGINAQIEALKRADAAYQGEVKDNIAAIVSLQKQGELTAVQAIRMETDARADAIAKHQGFLVQELAIAETKKNSQREQALLRGEISKADEDFFNAFVVGAGKEAEAQKKIDDALQKSRDKEIGGIDKTTAKIQEHIDKLNDEMTMHDKSAQAIERVNIARLEDQLNTALCTKNSEALVAALQKEIDKSKELIATEDKKDTYTASLAAQKKLEASWQKTSDKLGTMISDGLMRGFESGKGFADAFKVTLTNIFKTMILRPVIQAIVAPISGLSGAVSGGSSMLGGLSGVSNLFTNFGGSMTGSIATAGADLAHAGLDTFGHALFDNAATIGSSLQSLGTGLGYLNSIVDASNGKWGAAAGSAIGAYFGGPLGSMLGEKLGGLLDSAFAGEQRTGGQYGVSFDGTLTNQRRGETYTHQGQQFNRDGGGSTPFAIGSAALIESDGLGKKDPAIESAISVTAAGINAVLKSVGSAATLTGFSAGLETSGKGRGGVFSGGILSNGQTFGDSGKGTNVGGDLYSSDFTKSPDLQTAMANFGTSLKQSTIKALQVVTDIPKTIADMVKGVDAGKLTDQAATELMVTINAQIAAVNGFQAAVKQLPFENLKGLSFDAASGLAAAAGGFANLGTEVGTFYASYYTQAEQANKATSNVTQAFADMNVAVPANKDALRDLINAQDLTTDAGRKMYAQLLGVAGAFAQVTDAAAKEVQARATVQAQIDQLNGNANAVLAEQRKQQYDALYATDPVLADLTAKLWGLQDAAAAAAKAAADAAAATAARQQAQDAALATLGRSITAAKDLQTLIVNASQASVTSLTTLFGTLKTNVDALYGNVASSKLQSAIQGNAFITQALATAKATGVLPDNTALTDAINGARGGLDPSKYATSAQYEQAQLVLAGQLDTLKGLTGDQLTTAEKTLQAAQDEIKRLDAVLQANTDLLSVARNGVQATLSVADAVNALHQALKPDLPSDVTGPQSTKPAAAPDPFSNVSGGPGSGGAAAPAAPTSLGKQDSGRYVGRYAGGQEFSYGSGDAFGNYAGAQAAEQLAAKYQGTTGTVEDYLREAKASGITLNQIGAALGYNTADLAARAAAAGIPYFAAGGLFGGGARIVGENGPELEVTGPSRIYSAQQTKGMLNGGSEEMVQLLREIVTRLDAGNLTSKDAKDEVKDLTRIVRTVTDNGFGMKNQTVTVV
jgi:phage-related minor tail protein